MGDWSAFYLSIPVDDKDDDDYMVMIPDCVEGCNDPGWPNGHREGMVSPYDLQDRIQDEPDAALRSRF